MSHLPQLILVELGPDHFQICYANRPDMAGTTRPFLELERLARSFQRGLNAFVSEHDQSATDLYHYLPFP